MGEKRIGARDFRQQRTFPIGVLVTVFYTLNTPGPISHNVHHVSAPEQQGPVSPTRKLGFVAAGSAAINTDLTGPCSQSPPRPLSRLTKQRPPDKAALPPELPSAKPVPGTGYPTPKSPADPAWAP